MMRIFMLLCVNGFLAVDSASVTRRRLEKQGLEFGRIQKNDGTKFVDELERSLSDPSLAMSMPNDMSMPMTGGPTSLPSIATSLPNLSPTLPPTSFQSPIAASTSAPSISIPFDTTSLPTPGRTISGSESPSFISSLDSTTNTPSQHPDSTTNAPSQHPDSTTIAPTQSDDTAVPTSRDGTSNPTTSDSMGNDGTLSPTSSEITSSPTLSVPSICSEDTGDLQDFEKANLSIMLEVETRNNSTEFFDELENAILTGIQNSFSLCSPLGQNRVLVNQRRTNENLVRGVEAIDGPRLSETNVCTPEASENACFVVEEVIAVYAESGADTQLVSEEVFQVIGNLVESDTLFNEDTPAGDIVAVRLYESSTNSDSSINTDQKPNSPKPEASARTSLIVGLCVGIGGAASIIFAAFLVGRKRSQKQDEDKSYGSDESYTIQNSTCPSPLSSTESSPPTSPLQRSSDDSESRSESTGQLVSSDDMGSSDDMASSGESESPSDDMVQIQF
eukprot:CAMPEP_0195288086 /NCGR_PEP_ID=MMETSP0707-20130614/4891_1 /TAXON_ID=33640 /ORGANISM="Asterionellopsis glacialis, Strain CCMP134" /LENGTH=502 /DNA_ID=CAMNT_0040347907 /DNA_START=17 /DNA_END=1525 /DNA_ORIENTATION=-